MKTKTQVIPEEITELTLLSDPAHLLDTVESGNAERLPTKQLNVFYVQADVIEKAIKALKEKCRPVIVGRRSQGVPTGENLQHREFTYQTPQGRIKLTIQQRITWKPNPEKLEALLKQKNLWEAAQTTTLDMDKVQGLCQAQLITPDEMTSISDTPEPTYALIAKFDPKNKSRY